MTHAPTILIVEDNDDDFEACQIALSGDGNLANPIRRCTTGDDALDYLFCRGPYAETKPDIPGLILLDLNLPGTDGRSVVTEIKSNHLLRMIPVVVMTSSRDIRDIQACYSAGANSYVVKPVDLDGFLQAVARLKEYWFQIALLPVSR